MSVLQILRLKECEFNLFLIKEMEKFLLNEDGLCIFNFPETDIHSIRENAFFYTIKVRNIL